MKKKQFFIFCFLLILIPCGSYAGEYSLEDLYRLALEGSETIKIAEEDLYISEREKDRARSALLPTLSTFGSHTRYSEEKISNMLVLQPEYTNEWGVRLDQSFSLSGRELSAYKITKKGIRKSMYDLNAVKEEYLLIVASAYYDILKLKKALEITGANVERLTRHRNAARTRLEVGEVTRTALLRAEAELAGAQSEFIKSENDLRLSKTILAKTVNISGDYDLKEPRTGINSNIREQEVLNLLVGDCRQSTMDCLKETAFSERPEIKIMTLQKEIAEDSVTYARGSYWPDISLEGVYLRQENEPSSAPGLNERIYGILKLDFPLFEGGLRIAEVREAKARLRQVEQRLSDLTHSVSVEVENSYLNLRTVSSVIIQLQAEATYAGDNYNAVAKQFQHGLADSIDIIDANTLLVTAERELSNAKYDYMLAVLKLKRATGRLLKTAISHDLSTVSTEEDKGNSSNK